MNNVLHEMWSTWSNGGLVMAAMVILAVIMYATAVQLLRGLYYKGLTKASDSKLRDWIDRPEQAPARIRELIQYALDGARTHHEVIGRFREVQASSVLHLDRRIVFLNVRVIAAPLFGLLGTVLGMLLTFKAIGAGGGSATAEVIAKGISEALVATQTGMMVVIPGLIMATIAKRWRTEFVAFLARLESAGVRRFTPPSSGAKPPTPERPSPRTRTVEADDNAGAGAAEPVPA